MRFATYFAAAFATMPVAAFAQSEPLPGVSDEETVITSGGIEEFHLGKGDVIFVRDRTSRWYRVQLNDGCLDGPRVFRSLSVESNTPTGRIDKFSNVTFGEGIPRVCGIDSIRRSEAPPQVDSDSPVTLD